MNDFKGCSEEMYVYKARSYRILIGRISFLLMIIMNKRDMARRCGDNNIVIVS